MHSPLQLTPSPVYPVLQVQEKLPSEFVHDALTSQLFAPTHSSMSGEKCNT